MTGFDDTVERSPRHFTNMAMCQGNPKGFDDYHFDLDFQDISHYLLPVDDPVLDNYFDYAEEKYLMKTTKTTPIGRMKTTAFR